VRIDVHSQTVQFRAPGVKARHGLHQLLWRAMLAGQRCGHPLDAAVDHLARRAAQQPQLGLARVVGHVPLKAYGQPNLVEEVLVEDDLVHGISLLSRRWIHGCLRFRAHAAMSVSGCMGHVGWHGRLRMHAHMQPVVGPCAYSSHGWSSGAHSCSGQAQVHGVLKVLPSALDFTHVRPAQGLACRPRTALE
jgi:hypothetical protein